MILAAGLGTRLMPLTQRMPKALAPVNGTPMLGWTVSWLRRNGIDKIIVNVHHLAEQVIGYLKGFGDRGIEIAISDEREALLDTGGAIVKARWFLDGTEPFLVINTDVIVPVRLAEMIAFHYRQGAVATLAVCDRPASRRLLFDRDGVLSGWEDIRSGDRILARNADELRPKAFSGLHIIQPEFYGFNDMQGSFSVIRAYLKLAVSKRIRCYEHPAEGFFDLGDARKIEKAGQFMKDNPEMFPRP